MYLLGISCYYHDAAACLIKDGVIVFATQEERFTRIKNDESFPIHAIHHCLNYAKINMRDIEAIVYYEKPFLKLERLLKTYIQFAPKGLRSFVTAMQVWTSEKLFIKQNIYKALKNMDDNFDNKKIALLFSSHHLSHAASTFFVSPFNAAAILTIDGVGEYATTTLSIGTENTIKILKEIYFPHSIGLLYSSITYFLGFKVNSDEYKVMGLAAYGNKNSEAVKNYINTIETKLISWNEDGSYCLNMQYFTYPYKLTMIDDKVWSKLFNLPKRNNQEELLQVHADLAYAFQKITERAVLKLCNQLKKMTQSENLCLAGGVALNSVINGIIKQEKIFKQVFIQPAGGDAGGALGAALAAYYMHYHKSRTITIPDAMQNSLLGDEFSNTDYELIATQHKNYIYCNDVNELCNQVAQLIADGKVIGWFQRRMEFGPRALGNRSILADARNENMQLHLNLKIKNRESFRPFAPAVLEEDAKQYFDVVDTSPYMLEVYPVAKNIVFDFGDDYERKLIKEKLYQVKSKLPAITHVDGSARVQTVNKQNHPLFYQLISAFKQLTGCSVIINTSFNVKDEPIVRTPKDAYDCFMQTQMDILVLGNFIIFK